MNVNLNPNQKSRKTLSVEKKCRRHTLFSCLLEDVAARVAYIFKLQQLLMLLWILASATGDGHVLSISDKSDNDNKEFWEKKLLT
jgi:hypothetical protein